MEHCPWEFPTPTMDGKWDQLLVPMGGTKGVLQLPLGLWEFPWD
jgi:hypothetical protein